MEQFDTSARIAVLENEVKNIATQVSESRKESKEQHKLLMEKMEQMDQRLGIVERWRWMVVGAAMTIGFLIAHFVTK